MPSRHAHGPTQVFSRPGVREAYEKAQRFLSERLRAARLAKNWTQEQAAEQMGVHPKQIQRMEAGKANCSLATLVSASVALGVTLEELLGADSSEQ